MNTDLFVRELDTLIVQTADLSGRQTSQIRPFVCSGNPKNCTVFVVGTNPASTVSWSKFWNRSACNFDKERWLKSYEEERVARKLLQGKLRLSRQSTTRRRLEILVNEVQPRHQVLETNVYSVSTPAESDLRPGDRVSLIFDFLLRSIQPKAILAHGETAEKFIAANYRIRTNLATNEIVLPDGPALMISTPHLAARNGLVTNDKVRQWGKVLMMGLNKCSQSPC